ncbi:substrate-binding periplasmic protein [Niveispirillum cyanobacteriorum]|nr:transporter substrate-binding domain-containing protein [Niveispirillum cyanobacteriorum]
MWGITRFWLCYLFLTLLLIVFPAVAPAAAPLRLVVSDSLPPPYLILDEGGGEAKGLAIDLCRKVAERLGRDTTVRLAPPKRLPELVRAGEVDMVCHVAPGWYAYPDDLWFGRRLYTADSVFIAAQGAPSICDQCSLPAEVATVIGYEYGDRMRQGFDSGAVSRRDVRSEENVFRLVQHGRVSYGIISEYTFHYFAKGLRDVAIKGSVARFNITVGVPRSGSISEAELKIASAAIRLPQDVAPEYRAYLGAPAGPR